jgi:nickel-dependent lactate racemase
MSEAGYRPHVVDNLRSLLAEPGGPALGLSQAAAFVSDALGEHDWTGLRVALLVPDSTRTAPLHTLFPALAHALRTAAHVDVIVALGTHPPMTPEAIDQMLGVDGQQRAVHYPNLTVHNHAWDDPSALCVVGVIGLREAALLSDGLLADEVVVRINRLVADADHVVICGPVFPHEVAGFSGGAKYLFPGVSGPEVIDFTHWLGALATSMATVGVRNTVVRRVIHRAAALVRPPVSCLAFVLAGTDLHGIWYGGYEPVFDAAADLSAQLNIHWVERPVRTVVSIPSQRYEDLWTAAKAVYKTEPIVADDGEVVVFAPWLRDVSVTHGALIAKVGYHVRDYFLAQPERFADVPRAVLAHSTHVKGAGRYDAASGQELPRIRVTLATGIDELQVRALGLGYRDPAGVDLAALADDPDTLVVRNAGEQLFRLGPRVPVAPAPTGARL